MTLGARIEERRKAVGIKSQAELARRVDIPQTTMNGLIKQPYRWSPHLPRIARELGTSVDYLVGDVDDPETDAAADQLLSSDARQLLNCFEELSPGDRAAVLRHALSLAGKLPPAGRLHAPRHDFRAE